jgi:hypothetical protein
LSKSRDIHAWDDGTKIRLQSWPVGCYVQCQEGVWHIFPDEISIRMSQTQLLQALFTRTDWEIYTQPDAWYLVGVEMLKNAPLHLSDFLWPNVEAAEKFYPGKKCYLITKIPLVRE